MFVRFCGLNIPFWFQLEDEPQYPSVSGHWQAFFEAVRLKLNLSIGSYEIILPDFTAFGEVTGPNNGTGMIGHFLRNESDLALLPLSPTVENFPYVDFTVPAAFPDLRILTAIANQKSEQLTYDTVSIYENKIWYSLITCTFLFPILMCLKFKNKANAYGNALFCAYMYLVQQDYDKKVVDGSRISWTCWAIAAFCLTAIFKSLLLSKTTLPEPPLKIDFFPDILNYPNLQLVIMKDTSIVSFIRDSEDPIMKRVWDQIIRTDGVKTPEDIVINLEEFLEDAGLGKLAFVVSVDMFYQGCYNLGVAQKYLDRIRLSPETVMVELYSFCIRRGFNPELAKVFKDVTLRLTEQYITERALFFEQWKGERLFHRHHSDEPRRLSIGNFIFATVVASVGLLVSICVFTQEFCRFFKNSSKVLST